METIEKYNQPENAEAGYMPTPAMREAYRAFLEKVGNASPFDVFVAGYRAGIVECIKLTEERQ